MTLIDQIQEILEKQIRIAESLGMEQPAEARFNPGLLREISHIEGWFQHPLFYALNAGTTHFGPNAHQHSPVVNRVFVAGKALQIIEDPNAFLVHLDFAMGGWR